MRRSRSRDRAKNNISSSSSSGEQSYSQSTPILPKESLEKYHLYPKTIDSLQKMGITFFFPIQYQTFDYIYDGYDVIGKDRTGSGKTIAYALPILEKFRKYQALECHYPLFLIICPTRELVIQVSSQINKLKNQNRQFLCISIYGGTPIQDQIRDLRDGAQIIVATPGRLIDHIQRGTIKLTKIKVICIDEADQMLKMGFQQDIEKIFKNIKSQNQKPTQNLLFSATIPQWVHDISRKYLSKQRKYVDMIKDSQMKTSKTINHLLINCPYFSRSSTIADVVNCYGGRHGRTIIFCQTKKQVNQLLLKANLKQQTQVLHGDIPQKQREVTFKSFKQGRLKCLISTNVAARGLDIPQVDLIVQLQPPKDVQTYIHRSGRTGRAGRPGTCVTFYNKNIQMQVNKIERIAKIKFKRTGPPQPQQIIKSSARDIAVSLRQVSDSVIPYFTQIAQQLINQQGAVRALSKALAQVSGYIQKVQQRSLLCSIQGYITYVLRFPYQFTSVGRVFGFLRQQLPAEMVNDIKGVKKGSDNKYAVFDIPQKYKPQINALKQKIQSSSRYRGFTLDIAKTLDGIDVEQDRQLNRGFKGRSFNGHTEQRSFNGTRRKQEIFIGGLPYDANEQDVIQFFSKHRIKLVNIRFLRDEKGSSKGIAFGQCVSQSHYNDALNLNGQRLGHRILRINPANQK